MVSARCRSSERGAAVFIVVMVITLLTAVGLFAARAASLVDLAVGYDRQAVQTQYLSEYAGRLAALEFADPVKATLYNQRLQQAFDGAEKCPSNALVPNTLPSPPCLKLGTAEMDRLVRSGPSGTLLEQQDVAAEGSLGPPLGAGTTSMEGSLMVEVVDSYQTLEAPPGMDKGNTSRSPMAIQFTMTAWAQVRSIAKGDQDLENPWCADNDQSSASASVQRVRAYVTAPAVFR
jgi:hypothetical protein